MEHTTVEDQAREAQPNDPATHRSMVEEYPEHRPRTEFRDLAFIIPAVLVAAALAALFVFILQGGVA